MSRALARDLRAFQEQDQLEVLGINSNESKIEEIDAPTDLQSLFENLDLLETKEEEAWEGKTYKISHSTDVSSDLESLETIPGLPIAIFELILMFVGENWFQNCIEAVPGWKKRIDSEFIWQSLCTDTFKQPAFNPIRLLKRVPRKYKSWRLTALKRPRVKFSGVYIHRHTYIRDRGPENMWSVGHTRYLQISHYRYALFLSNGNVLYASTPIEPKRMLPLFHSILLKLEDKKHLLEIGYLPEDLEPAKDGKTRRIFLGSYKVFGKDLSFVVNLGNYSVRFGFELDDLNTITAITHQSLNHLVYKPADNCVDSFDRIEEHQIIHHSLATLYRFEREWKFKPLF